MTLAAVAGAVTNVVEIAKGVEWVYTTLDGARSCVITVKNHTDLEFEIVGEQKESGGYKVPPNQRIGAQEFQVFGAQDTGFMTGAIGNIRYRARPFDSANSVGEWLYIRWANPFVGANAASGDAYTARIGREFPSTKTKAFARAGSGNTAEMLFELYPQDRPDRLAAFPDGSVIIETGHPEVYVIQGGAKFWIPNPSVLEQYYGGWDAVGSLSEGTFAGAGIGDVPIDGTLLKEPSDPIVWRMNAGQKCWIITPDVLARYGGWDAVRMVPDGAMLRFAQGPAVTA